MGFRFRRSVKILPGIKLNMSKKGVSSVSIGRAGATMNINRKGTKTTVGIPGSGLSYSTKRSGRTTASRPVAARSNTRGWLVIAGLILIGFIVALSSESRADQFCYYWIAPDGTTTSYKEPPFDLSTPPNTLRPQKEGHLIIGQAARCSDNRVLNEQNTVITSPGGSFSVAPSATYTSSYRTPSSSSSSTSTSGGRTWVDPYVKKDGTSVRGHWRNLPSR